MADGEGFGEFCYEHGEEMQDHDCADAGPRAADTTPDELERNLRFALDRARSTSIEGWTEVDRLRARVAELEGALTEGLHAHRREVHDQLARAERAEAQVAELENAGKPLDDVLGALLRELAPIPWGLYEDATVARNAWRSAAGGER